jgi:hypothetical protein
MNTKQIPKFPGAPKLEHLMQKLTSESFYGEVHIIFKNGRPMTVNVKQTYRMNDL